jgi:hypothetical protein
MKRSITKPEQFNIQFLGMKFNSINPGRKTITILIILLVFFLTLVLLLKAYALPAIATIGNTKAAGAITAKTSFIRKWIKGRWP